MMMNLSEMVKLEEGQAIVKIIEGEKVYNKFGDFWYKEGDTLFCNNQGEVYPSGIALVAFLRRTSDWYVKKPFDVRAEMLARPNEWVGAFKNRKGGWSKVGFDNFYMLSVETDINVAAANYTLLNVYDADPDTFDKCIPIEDVPKEEL